MIPKSEWQAANQQVMEEERRRLGAPPDDETIARYLRGELAAAEEDRVRAHLAANPELARPLAAPFPSDDPGPGEPGYVSEEELALRWKDLQSRMSASRASRGRVLRFWRASAALAASLAIVFGVLLWRAEAERRQPIGPWEEQLLLPDGHRGAGDTRYTALTAQGESVLLVGALVNQPHFPDYRVEIVDVSADPPRKLWASDSVSRRENDTFSILVPRSFLKRGQYRIVLYGADGARQEQLATYSFSVER